MAEVKGVTQLLKKLKGLEDQIFSNRSVKHRGREVRVGYSAPHAVFVHEMIKGAPNPPRHDAQRRAMFASINEREARGHVSWAVGQPKFLEQPARQYQKQMGRIVVKALKGKKTLIEALTEAAEFLKERSQELCPVDTGELKKSAYVKVIEV